MPVVSVLIKVAERRLIEQLRYWIIGNVQAQKCERCLKTHARYSPVHLSNNNNIYTSMQIARLTSSNFEVLVLKMSSIYSYFLLDSVLCEKIIYIIFSFF